MGSRRFSRRAHGAPSRFTGAVTVLPATPGTARQRLIDSRVPPERAKLAHVQARAAEERGDYARAIAIWQTIIRAAPGSPVGRDALAQSQVEAGRLEEALVSYSKAIELTPKELTDWRARFRRDRGLTRFALGDYGETAWNDHECRRQLPLSEGGVDRPPVSWPEWNGGDIGRDRLIILPEQGFGDQIQFARFAPLLQARGVNVIIACQPSLERLFQSLKVPVWPIGRRTIGPSWPEVNWWIATMSVPHRLAMTLADLPADPYLSACRGHVPPGARIGVVTNGRPEHQNDAARSLTPDAAARLRSLRGAFSLLPQDTGARDFLETAQMIQALDLVITVDTSIAHLAGAMGKPVWILLPRRHTDWRWMRDRSDSPWYPSARLYRQPKAGDWRSVIDQVEGDLAHL